MKTKENEQEIDHLHLLDAKEPEKFKDGIISPLTKNCYVVFNRGKVPDNLQDFKGFIHGFSTGVDPVGKIVKKMIDAVKVSEDMPTDKPTVAMIIYQDPDEKKNIIEGLEKEITKVIVIGAIAENFNIDPHSIFTKEQEGWTDIMFDDISFKYKIGYFIVTHKKILIYLDKYGFEKAGLGEKIAKKPAKEAAKGVANYIIENSGIDKEINIYRLVSEGLDELDGYTQKLLYPAKEDHLHLLGAKAFSSIRRK